MSNKYLRIMEISVILVQFISSLVTAFYCSYCLSDIDALLNFNEYSWYLSDIQKQYKFIFNLNLGDSITTDNNALSHFINGTCTNTGCKSNSVENYIWKGGILNFNEGIEYDDNYIKFRIISANDSCSDAEIKCFSNEYYKTCMTSYYGCPVTGLLSKNYSENMNEQFREFYHLNESVTMEEFIIKNEFKDVAAYKTEENSTLMYSTLIDGIPIINIKTALLQPCNFDYVIKSNAYFQKLNANYYELEYFNCLIFQNFSDIPKDSEEDFDSDFIKFKLRNPSINEELSSLIYDNRYISIDSVNLKDYLVKIKLLNATQKLKYNLPSEPKLNLYIKKLFYAKEECAVNMFNIINLTDVYNMGQIKIILVRYLNWNFIDIIFILFLNIYTRGLYLIKRIRKVKHGPGSDPTLEDDEKKLQKETSTVVKLLHYFIIIIKIVSGLVSRYVYMNFNLIPSDNTFYESCLTDQNTLNTFKKINPVVLDLYSSTLNISNLNIITLGYDLVVTMFIVYKSYRKSFAFSAKTKLHKY